MGARMREADGFCALELAPAEPAGPRRGRSPACRLPDFRRRSGCVPAEPYPPLKQPEILYPATSLTSGPMHYSAFARTDLFGFARTTTAHSSKFENQSHRRFQVAACQSRKKRAAEGPECKCSFQRENDLWRRTGGIQIKNPALKPRTKEFSGVEFPPF